MLSKHKTHTPVSVDNIHKADNEQALSIPTQREEPFFDFLALSAELRNRIYTFAVLLNPDLNGTRNPGVLTVGDSPRQPPITRVCRQLRTESLPIYYVETAFNVDLTDKLDLSGWAGGSTPDVIDTEEAEYRRQTQATTDFYPDTQATFWSSYEWFVMFVQAFQDSHLHLLRKISITITAEFTFEPFPDIVTDEWFARHFGCECHYYDGDDAMPLDLEVSADRQDIVVHSARPLSVKAAKFMRGLVAIARDKCTDKEEKLDGAALVELVELMQKEYREWHVGYGSYARFAELDRSWREAGWGRYLVQAD